MTHGRTLCAAFGLALAALAAPGTASAAAFDIDLSNNAARADYRFAITDSGLYGDFGLLHHENDGDMLFGGIQLVGDAGKGAEAFTVGLGARLVNIDANVIDGTALGIGGFFRYVVPEYNRFAFGGHVYIAPKVTSFGDMERYLEYGVRGEYRVMEKASVYLGLREVRADFVGGVDATIDDGLHLGISLEF